MTYPSNRPLETSPDNRIHSANIVEFGDRVHWGAIISGLVVAISSQLLLSSLGAALGFSNIAGSEAPRTESSGVAQAVGVWTILSVFIFRFHHSSYPNPSAVAIIPLESREVHEPIPNPARKVIPTPAIISRDGSIADCLLWWGR